MQYDSLSQLQTLSAESPTQGSVSVQITRKDKKQTKTGHPYLEIHLSDVGATLPVKIWDNAPWYPSFLAVEINDYVSITATWQSGQYGMEMSGAELRPLSAEEEANLLNGGDEQRLRQQKDWDSISALVDSMKDPRLKTLSRTLLEDFETRFRRTAAARGYHHARRGGLVEHTAGVMRTAEALSHAYPDLNRDLLLTGALFHDCGKMWENAYEEHGLNMPYSDSGELLGHITIGIELINRLWKSKVATEDNKAAWKHLTPATEQVRLHLLHLIAAHHGSLEFGSPVVPKTPEALALNHADNMDAKMEMFRAAYAESATLSPSIRQRRAPLPGNIVIPLPHFVEEEMP